MKAHFAVVAGAIAGLAITMSAHAATITWTSSTGTAISGDSDVLNTGTLVNATNVDGNTVTVNGVIFTGAGETSGSVVQGNLTVSISGGLSAAGGAYGGTAAPFNTLSANYQSVIGSGDYQDGGNTESIVYTGLTAGDKYEFQFWANDSRTCCSNNMRNETLTAGNSAEITYYNATGVNGQVGQFVTGDFVADGTGQTISLVSGSGNVQNNALTLRDLGPNTPEPASLGLLGIAGLGLLARRRRA